MIYIIFFKTRHYLSSFSGWTYLHV